MVHMNLCGWCCPDPRDHEIERFHELYEEAMHHNHTATTAPSSSSQPTTTDTTTITPDKAEEAITHALSIASSCTPIYHYGVQLCLNFQSKSQIANGQWRRAETTLVALAKNSSVVEDYRMEMCAYGRLGLTYIAMEDYTQAAKAFQKAVDLAQQLCDVHEEIVYRINHANALVLGKKISVAIDQISLLRSGKGAEVPELFPFLTWNQIWCELLNGKVPELDSVSHIDDASVWTIPAVLAELTDNHQEKLRKWSNAASKTTTPFAMATCVVTFLKHLQPELRGKEVDLGVWADVKAFNIRDQEYLMTVAHAEGPNAKKWSPEEIALAKSIAQQLIEIEIQNSDLQPFVESLTMSLTDL